MQILAVVVLCLAKCSNVALMTRVFSFDQGRRDKVFMSCCVLQALNITWGVGSIAALATCCNPALLLTVTKQCSTQVSHFQDGPDGDDIPVLQLC